MSFPTYPFNLLDALSAFWRRFFADQDQLEELYRGVATLAGQAYLQVLEGVLTTSLQDCPVFSRDYFRMVTLREDGVAFVEGAVVADDRWLMNTDADLAYVPRLDSGVVEPGASLEESVDYDSRPAILAFRTDPTRLEAPVPGFARRQVNALTGGLVDVASRPGSFVSWLSGTDVRKGDILRVIDVGLSGQQVRRSDHAVVLVRANLLALDPRTPLASGAPRNVVVLRRPGTGPVLGEPVSFVAGVAQLGHTRLVAGSVRVRGRAVTGEDVREGLDYAVDYEGGKVLRLRPFLPGPVTADYAWLREVYPATGPSPRLATDGIVTTGTVRVVEVAAWVADARVDRRYLARTYGIMVGREEASSEAYRQFLRGIFRLYSRGPVLARVESALNSVLGLPVVVNDGEVLAAVDTSDPRYRAVVTTDEAGVTHRYQFPVAIPLRADVLDPASVGVLRFAAFDTLSLAVRVTDRLEDPAWWWGTVAPRELFSAIDGAFVPDLVRRTASPLYVPNVVNPQDGARVGDPGVIAGADDEGNIIPAGKPVHRRQVGFVIFQRYLQHHTFLVQLHPAAFTATGIPVSPDELRRLVLSARPAHTYPIAEPTTGFRDLFRVTDEGWYQSARFPAPDPDGPEVFPTEADVPDPGRPHLPLGLRFGPNVRHRDVIEVVDPDLRVGFGGWRSGDYFHYESATETDDFTGGTVTLGGVPGAPRTRRVVKVVVDATVAGAAVVEGTDYTVDYVAGDVTRTTAWDSNMVSVHFTQLNVGNIAFAPPNTSVGDVPLLVAGQDGSAVRGPYAPDTGDDVSMVERPVTIRVM